MFFTLDDLKNAVVVTRYAAEINWNDNLGSFSNSGFHGIVIHFRVIFLRIDHDDFRTDVINDRGGRRICISRHDNFVTFANTEYVQCHFRAGGL